MKGLVIIMCMFACARGMSVKKESSQVSISFHATDLKKCDLITACDTSVTIICQSIHSDWKECGTTRRILNNNNPVWPKIFTFDHEPGTRQRWRFDLKEHNLLGSKIMGSFIVNMDEYVEEGHELVEHFLPNDRGSLWVQRTTSTSI